MALQLIPLFPGVPGGMELAVILLIAVLLFGANKIPKLARSTGEAMGEFKKGREQVERELKEMQDGATTTESSNTVTTETTGSSPDIGPTEAQPIDDTEAEAETDVDTDEDTEAETNRTSTEQ